MKKEILFTVKTQSGSSTRVWETLVYADGSTSCNCPGWCKRVAADGSRSCKHTEAAEAKIDRLRVVA